MRSRILQCLVVVCSFIILGCSKDESPEIPGEGGELNLPEINTPAGENAVVASFTSIEVTGTVKPPAGSVLHDYGVVWSNEPNPTLEDRVVVVEDATGAVLKKAAKQSERSFTLRITDLEPNNMYYLRIFATSEEGTAYGDEVSHNTLSLEETKWRFVFDHTEDVSWIADVEFYEDGTAFYTEPDYPGVYDQHGTWSLEGTTLTYDMIPDTEEYLLTGEISENAMSGTYTFPEIEGGVFTWDAVPYSTVEEEEEEEENTSSNVEWWDELEEPLKRRFNEILGNGYVTAQPTQEEAENLLQSQTLDLSDLGITNLDILGKFDKLINLRCVNNNLTTLDLREIPGLEILEASENQLSMIFFPASSSLKKIDLTDNSLNEIDLQDVNQLTDLFLSKNQLTGLEIDHLTNLKYLGVFSNNISNLDLEGLDLLENINIHSNELTKLDATGIENLSALNVARNNINELKVTNLNNLTHLLAEENDLSSLDLSGLQSLTHLYINANRLTSLDVTGSTGLKKLIVVGNSLTSLNLEGLVELEELNCGDNNLTSLEVENLESLKILWCQSNSFNFSSMKSLMESLPVSVVDFKWTCDNVNNEECEELQGIYDNLF